MGCGARCTPGRGGARGAAPRRDGAAPGHPARPGGPLGAARACGRPALPLPRAHRTQSGGSPHRPLDGQRTPLVAAPHPARRAAGDRRWHCGVDPLVAGVPPHRGRDGPGCGIARRSRDLSAGRRRRRLRPVAHRARRDGRSVVGCVCRHPDGVWRAAWLDARRWFLLRGRRSPLRDLRRRQWEIAERLDALLRTTPRASSPDPALR